MKPSRTGLRLLVRLGAATAGILVCVFLYFDFSTLLDWHSRGRDWIENLRHLDSLITEADTARGSREFQFDASGGLTEVRTSRIEDRDGVLAAEFYPNTHLVVPERRIPSSLASAVIAMEDRRFYSHHGIDFRSLTRAFLSALLHGRVTMGGSTITQQLAKVLFTSSERTLRRKFIDIRGAIEIEKRYSKRRILSMYLNTVYFGHATFGAESASRFFFDKKASDLDVSEAAMLAGLLSRPNVISPYNNPGLCRAKQTACLERMARLGFIRRSDIDSKLERFWRTYAARFDRPRGALWQMKFDRNPEFDAFVLQRLTGLLGEDFLRVNPVRVRLSLKLSRQAAFESVLADPALARISGEQPARLRAVCLDPRTGSIEAMAATGSGPGACVSEIKPVGRLILPFLYGIALDQATASGPTAVTDSSPSGDAGVPDSRDSRGGILDGLRGLDAKTVLQFLQPIGNAVVGSTLKEIWRHSGPFDSGRSLVAGSLKLSVLQVCQGYAVLANGGIPERSDLFDRVTDLHGEILADFSGTQVSNGRAEQAIFTPAAAGAVSEALSRADARDWENPEPVRRTMPESPVAFVDGPSADRRSVWVAVWDRTLVLVVRLDGPTDHGFAGDEGMAAAQTAAIRLWKSVR